MYTDNTAAERAEALYLADISAAEWQEHEELETGVFTTDFVHEFIYFTTSK